MNKETLRFPIHALYWPSCSIYIYMVHLHASHSVKIRSAYPVAVHCRIINQPGNSKRSQWLSPIHSSATTPRNTRKQRQLITTTHIRNHPPGLRQTWRIRWSLWPQSKRFFRFQTSPCHRYDDIRYPFCINLPWCFPYPSWTVTTNKSFRNSRIYLV